MVKMILIDKYKLLIDHISGISDIDKIKTSYYFDIFCGGNIRISRKNKEELEKIHKKTINLWNQHINLTNSIKEIEVEK